MADGRKKSNIKNHVLVGVFAAVICVLSVVPIPFVILGVPATLQTFAIALSGFVLGKKRGVAATCIYVLVGLAGLPVFGGGRGGIEVIFNLTGGFLYGFLFLAFFCGMGQQKSVKTVIYSTVGLLLCHGAGIIQFSLITGRGFAESLILVTAPYIVKDAVMVAVAYTTALGVRKTGAVN